MTRVCLYLRISTDEDHQPTSLRTQQERLERYCHAMEDWRVVRCFEDQASGVTLERPGLRQALGLARPTTSARWFHSGEPGAVSGRHGRQARKPSRCAAAADGRNRTLERFGVIAEQDGRQ